MLKIKIVNKSSYSLPRYQTSGSAGMDVFCNEELQLALLPLERKLIPTGIFLELPDGIEVQIRPRSGLAIKQGLTLLNSPGTIDSDYRGEIKIILINLSNETQLIKPGDRIAQLVFAKYEKITWEQVDNLSESERGEGGFGHTGKK
ncbi:MAG: dUTP diphosphatase [Chitinophagaceae bacterium]|nr:dUTP diphosphatase [Chitinophagaceae bacterium]